MLRTIFISILLILGGGWALKGPLEGLLFYVWIAYFRPDEWAYNGVFATMNLSFIAAIYLLIRSVLSGTRFRFDLRTALLAAILIQSTVSAWNSDYSFYSLETNRAFIKSIVITYMIGILATDTKKLRLVVLVLSLSLGFEAAKQGWAQLVLNPGGRNVNESYMLGDNNGVAVGMLMLVSFLVALGRTTKSIPERWLHRFLSVGVLYRAISTYSRGGFLAAGALGLIHVARSKQKTLALTGAAIAAVITLSVLPPAYWSRMSTINVQEGTEMDSSAAGRLHFWKVAVDMAADHPMLGVGTTAYNLAYNQYDFSGEEYGSNRSVHSMWLGILSELGYPGLILLVANIGLAVLACGRARRLARKGLISAELGELATAFESAFVVVAVGGTFVIFQYSELLWHLIGLSLAVHFLTTQELAKAAANGAVRASSPVPARQLVGVASARSISN